MTYIHHRKYHASLICLLLLTNTSLLATLMPMLKLNFKECFGCLRIIKGPAITGFKKTLIFEVPSETGKPRGGEIYVTISLLVRKISSLTNFISCKDYCSLLLMNVEAAVILHIFPLFCVLSKPFFQINWSYTRSAFTA